MIEDEIEDMRKFLNTELDFLKNHKSRNYAIQEIGCLGRKLLNLSSDLKKKYWVEETEEK